MGDRLFLNGRKSIFPGATTSENSIPFESVSMPLGREAPSVGLVGDGERKDESRSGGWRGHRHQRHARYIDGRWDPTDMGPLTNWTSVGDKVPVHNTI